MNCEVRSPATLDEALVALQGATPATRILAGGTDLMVEFEIGRTRPDRVVDIWKLAELRRIERDAGGLRLGALVTCGSAEPPAETLPAVSAQAPPAARRPEVASCLALVERRDFQKALPVCREARRAAPNDQEVRAAVQVAQAHLAQPAR